MSARLLLAVAASLWTVPVAAQETGSRPSREYVQAATQSDTFELREAESALAGSGDARVRDYARMMLRDHGATDAALRQAAAKSGIAPPPMQLGNDQAQFLAALQSLTGPEFDRAYARQQALAHRAALEVQRGYAESGDDPNLRAAAARATPVIASHLDAAERLKGALGE